MKKIFNLCLMLIGMVMFNTMNVNALEVKTYDELKSCVNTGGECILGENIDIPDENINIVISKDVIIDINGYSINYPYIYNLFNISDGKTIIKDSKDTGIINAKWSIFNITGGSLEIENGKYKSSSSPIISLEDGKVIVKNGDFQGIMRSFQVNGGNLRVDGGTFTGNEGIYVHESAVNSIIEINNATINTNNTCIKVDAGKTTINYAEGTSKNSCININNNSTTIINDGKFELIEDSVNPVITNWGANLTINGGTFSTHKESTSAVLIFTEEDDTNKTIVNNGNFYGEFTIMNDSIKSKHLVEIYNGNFVSDLGSAVYADPGNLNIYNGTFTSNEYCALDLWTGKGNIYGGTFTGNEGGACFYYNEDLNVESLKGGTFTVSNKDDGFGAVVIITDDDKKINASELLSPGYAYYEDDSMNFVYHKEYELYYSYTKATSLRVDKIKNEDVSTNDKTDTPNENDTLDKNTEDKIENPKTGVDDAYMYIGFTVLSVFAVIYFKSRSLSKFKNIQ